MLENDAKKKRCPYKMAHSAAGDGVAGIYCNGTGCMGWDEWKNLTGQCGMKPPDRRK